MPITARMPAIRHMEPLMAMMPMEVMRAMTLRVTAGRLKGDPVTPSSGLMT